MSENLDIRDAISLWPSRNQLAKEVGENLATVHKWYKFNRIPAAKHAKFILAAKRRKYRAITAEWIVKAHCVEPDKGAAA